jgi:glycosyltransferase involved in cell wall biosynthesis
MNRPELSVVVGSHDRPLRLRWLLNALDQQTLDRSLWEVVVCHDSAGSESDELLAAHALATSGVLRFTRLAPGTAPPGANRNAALRLARAPTIVFTDDDCRPPADWLANVLAAVQRNPGAIVQGPVHGDPDEYAMRSSPYPRGVYLPRVPRPFAECCNIVYPRELIDKVGGFVEDVYTGEDTDLNIRARAAGGSFVGDQSMLTYHAIEEGWLLSAIRGVWRWGDLALLVKRHPEFRREFALWIFWKRTHVWLPLALVGLRLERRNPLWGALVVPWAVQWQSRHGGTRGRMRHLLELPGWALIDLAEMAAMARGSLRHRTVLL